MKKIKIITYIFFISFYGMLALEAGEKIQTGILPIKGIQCPGLISTKCTNILSQELENSGIFTIVHNNDKKPLVLIDGTVRRIFITVRNEEKTRYVSRRIEGTKYRFTISGIDSNTGTTEFTFTDSAWGGDRYNAVRRIARKIIERYRKKLNRHKPDIRYSLKLSAVSASMSVLHAQGLFSEYAKAGIGADLHVKGRLMPGNIHLSGQLGCFFMEPQNPAMYSMQILFPSIRAGYEWRFRHTAGLSFMPLLGAGYMVHIIKGDTDGMDASGEYTRTRDYYYDPAIVFGCEIGVATPIGGVSTYRVYLAPSYIVFFEQGAAGSLFSVSIGVNKKI